MTSSSPRTPWRSAPAVIAGLIGALVSSVAIGAYQLVVNGQGDTHTSAGSGQTSASGTMGTEPASSERATPFTSAAAGTCLNWEFTQEGEVTSFERVSCEEPHRFEVSSREDLGAYPASEFGPDSEIPDVTRQAQLREELCLNPTVRYLDGSYDPLGRYSVASILPPPERWAAGDRTLLCGVQSTNAEGVPIETTGHAAEQDQARVAQPGQCQWVDDANSLTVVPCEEDHHIEITAIVDLAPQFPDHTPAVEEQDAYLREACTQAAIDYLGGEENLYQSTLQPYWNVIPEASWVGGSRSTNCGLVNANPDTGFFSVLTGSATNGPEGFTIDGNPPPPQPERTPLRTEQPVSPAPAPGHAH